MHGAPGCRHIVPPIIEFQDSVGEALVTDLNFSGAKAAQAKKLLVIEMVRSCLQDQADTTRRCTLVRSLDLQELVPSRDLIVRLSLASEEVPDDLVVALLHLPSVDLPRLISVVDRRLRVMKRRWGRRILRASVIQGIQASSNEPELIGLWIRRPGTAQDDELDLVDRMTDVVIGAEP